MAHATYGQAAFEAFQTEIGGSASWDSLSQAERDAWNAAGGAVIEARRTGSGEPEFTGHDVG